MAPFWRGVSCLSTASHRREETRIFPSPTLLHRSPPNAPPFPVWEHPLGALCLEMCLHPQGKSTFLIFSFIQNENFSFSCFFSFFSCQPHQSSTRCHPSGGQVQYGNLQMLKDTNTWTCSEQHQRPRPVSLHPHQCQDRLLWNNLL